MPNAFTILRLLLVPWVIRAIWTGHLTRALILFAGAAITDLLDGAIARRFRLSSPAGAYLDPIADKVLLSGVYLALAGSGTFPWWLVILIFGRDLYILLGVGVFLWMTPIRKFPPSVWGKVSTFVQVATAVVWMARNLLFGPVLEALMPAMLWPCAAVTIASGVHYTWRGVQLARTH
ncbi:MAG: CDP-alcohol phosphatidyltransferase family protein [Acidobacteriia bacterium]|nr:CDP-alcohol phosphatidyltransferase family protein [Terriglobia bacterium]